VALARADRTVVEDHAPDFRRLVVGVDAMVPVADGGERPFINLDHAASTPPFVPVLESVTRLALWYGNVHRGAGFKARLSSWAFEQARERVHRFVGADPVSDITLFTRNTTEAINHLAARLTLGPDAVVLVTGMEHHSNDLPWRRVARVVHVDVTADGLVDETDLQRKLREHRESVRLLAVTGASNVTGLVNPIHTYARWAHAAGAQILIDAAQLVAHRPIDMHAGPPAEHLDYLAFSAHKMYAPFGVGALVGARRALAEGLPYQVGGGAVEVVDRTDVVWADLPEREEAGTPCVIGAVALAAAIEVYQSLGWPRIQRHEAAVTAHAHRRLMEVPGLTLYGGADRVPVPDRLGVFAFNLMDLPHKLVAAILSCEWAIGTRSGCFCAHLYMQQLLGIDDDWAVKARDAIARSDRSTLPGAVRASFGLATTVDEVDALVTALTAIAHGRYRSDYRLDTASGEYAPSGWSAGPFSRYLAGSPLLHA
jgi:selenocysteine lyase/cysteine desulfurase